MALYRKPKNVGTGTIEPLWREDVLNGIAPAKIDEMLLEALDALAQAKRLHESTSNPETKRQTKRILENLHSSLLKLAPLGVHSVSRLENLPATP